MFELTLRHGFPYSTTIEIDDLGDGEVTMEIKLNNFRSDVATVVGLSPEQACAVGNALLEFSEAIRARGKELENA